MYRKIRPHFAKKFSAQVAAVFRVRDPEEAIDLANDSEFGLAASAWTNDPIEQELFASEFGIRNGFHQRDVGLGSRLPFGGVKRSASAASSAPPAFANS